MLLIDNYDSFAHNLARYFHRLGQTPTVIRNDAITAEQVMLEKPRALIFSPGPCTPDEAGNCLAIATAMKEHTPMLGVCLGHQVIAQAWGGRIVRAPSPVHGRSSAIHHQGNGVFAGLASPMRVGRYHSLIVDAATLPTELEPIATTDDGIVMAFQHVELPIVGLQFHPESVLTDQGYALLAAFLRIAGIACEADLFRLCESDLPPSSGSTQPSNANFEPPRHPVTF